MSLYKKSFTLLLIFVLSALSVQGATPREKLDALSLEIMEGFEGFHPVLATQMGVHHYDHLFTDWSAKSVKDMKGTVDKFERRLHDFKNGNGLDAYGMANYRLMKAEADVLYQDIDKIKWQTFAPQLYSQELLDGIYSLVLAEYIPLNERLVTIVGRMKAVPAYLATAKKNLKDVPAVYKEIAIGQLNKGIDFYQAVASYLMNQYPDRADEILRVSTKAREAMNDFLVYLTDLPAVSDEKASVGKLNYEYILSHKHFVPFGADSLLSLAESLLVEIQAECAEQQSFVMENQNGQDSVFIPASFSAQDILDYYSWEAAQVPDFVEDKQLVDLPDWMTEMEIQPIPAYCRMMIPAMQYNPSNRFDSLSSGIFFVRPIPNDLSPEQLAARYRYVYRRGMRESLVREGIPGQHLMAQFRMNNEDPVRRWVGNVLMREGWAHYFVELVYHEGFYGKGDEAMYLLILENAREEAALAVADIRFHTGLANFDEILSWLYEATQADSDSARLHLRERLLEASWHPADALGATIGQWMLESMREAGSDNEGIDFSERDFHNQILNEGEISPFLLQELMGLQAQE